MYVQTNKQKFRDQNSNLKWPLREIIIIINFQNKNIWQTFPLSWAIAIWWRLPWGEANRHIALCWTTRAFTKPRNVCPWSPVKLSLIFSKAPSWDPDTVIWKRKTILIVKGILQLKKLLIFDFEIAIFPDNERLLNSRNELISKCRHMDKFMQKKLNDSKDWRQWYHYIDISHFIFQLKIVAVQRETISIEKLVFTSWIIINLYILYWSELASE